MTIPDELRNELVELAARAIHSGYCHDTPCQHSIPFWYEDTDNAELALTAILPRLVSHLSGQAGEHIRQVAADIESERTDDPDDWETDMAIIKAAETVRMACDNITAQRATR